VRLPRRDTRFNEDSLLRTGVILLAMAVVLVFAVATVIIVLGREPETVVASNAKAAQGPEVLVRGEPPGDAWTEGSLTQPEPSTPSADRPEPEPEPPAPERETPPAEELDWPKPTEEELEAAKKPRRYELPPGAIMGLTMKTLNVHNAPVFDSDSSWALDNGVAHVPETSLPWTRTPQRNVYLEGHRIGWPGRGSHMVFYYLNRLQKGDEILLKDRNGRKFTYRVSETLVVDPEDVWVMGQVRGRDIVTLQTCTPIPTWEKRLIVRADRV
jgi:sortase A